MQAATITDVIKRLDEIIAWSKVQNHRIGYFATLYRGMTVAVQKGIAANLFEDANRMERLDVIFANRYLDAWQCYQNKQACTASWKTAFDASASNNLTVVQHLLLGINTHINLDLAIAAAETSKDADIFSLQKDFEKINEIIASLTEVTYNSLCKLWFPLRFLGKLTGNRHDAVVNFSIGKAREASWTNAVALFQCNEPARKSYINFIDGGVVMLANKIIEPGRYIKFLLAPVRFMEAKNVAKNIELLQ